jgi:hypothetical protein
MPLLYMLIHSIKRHYDQVEHALAPQAIGVPLPSRVHAVVLVSRLNTPALRALAFARATRPSTLVALNVRTTQADTDALMAAWDARDVPVALTVLDSPYCDITRPVVEYIADVRRESPRDVVAVFVPEYVVEHWWEQFVHNQSALRIKARLLFQGGVMVISAPWRFGHEPDPAASVAQVVPR